MLTVLVVPFDVVVVIDQEFLWLAFNVTQPKLVESFGGQDIAEPVEHLLLAMVRSSKSPPAVSLYCGQIKGVVKQSRCVHAHLVTAYSCGVFPVKIG
jgi:hypothetical protein